MQNYHLSNMAKQAMSGMIALFLILFAVVETASAQNAVNKIEVKDGKVYVNGEMVKELEDAELPLVFRGDRSSAKSTFTVDSAGDLKSDFFVFELDGDVVNGSGSSVFFKSDNITSDNDDVMVLYGRHKMGAGKLAFGNQHATFELLDNSFQRSGAMWGNSPFGSVHFGNRGETDEIRLLESEAAEMAGEIRSASDGEQEGLQSMLKELLGRIFDLKIDNTEERLDKMNIELNTLSDRIEDRNQSREDIIQQRYNELVGKGDSLAW